LAVSLAQSRRLRRVSLYPFNELPRGKPRSIKVRKNQFKRSPAELKRDGELNPADFAIALTSVL